MITSKIMMQRKQILERMSIFNPSIINKSCQIARIVAQYLLVTLEDFIWIE